jgi:hypothetical protein
LCSSDKKEALLSWPGYTRERTTLAVPLDPNEDWSWINPFLNSGALLREISHLKILYSSHACLEAKAYLGMENYG